MGRKGGGRAAVLAERLARAHKHVFFLYPLGGTHMHVRRRCLYGKTSGKK